MAYTNVVETNRILNGIGPWKKANLLAIATRGLRVLAWTRR